MRLGILGGTFDPIHLGHLDAAGAARRALALDRVLLVPAHVPPHRASRPRASAYHRFAMVALAASAAPGCEASDIELRDQGPSYTVHTLRRLHAEGLAPSQIFFIIGVDAFADIATWHEYPAVLDAANFVVVSRPGYDVAQLRRRLPALADRFVDLGTDGAVSGGSAPPEAGSTVVYLLRAAPADVSSTEVRRRLDAGEPLDGLVPDAVARHIVKHRLYSSSPAPADRLHGQD